MTITEPTTVFTDYLLAAATLYWGIRVWRANSRLGARLWSFVFLATAIAAVAGGTIHGFKIPLGEARVAALWAVVSAAIGGASFCLLAAASLAHAVPPWRLLLVVFAGGKLISIPLRPESDFRFIVYDYALSLAAVLVVAILAWRRDHSPAARWLIDGVLLSIVAAAIQQSGITFAQDFNHNDLYHLVQMVAFYFFYRSAMYPYVPPNRPDVREPAKVKRAAA